MADVSKWSLKGSTQAVAPFSPGLRWTFDKRKAAAFQQGIIPVKDLFHIPTISWDGLRKTQVQTAFVPRVDPVSGAMCASLAFVF